MLAKPNSFVLAAADSGSFPSRNSVSAIRRDDVDVLADSRAREGTKGHFEALFSCATEHYFIRNRTGGMGRLRQGSGGRMPASQGGMDWGLLIHCPFLNTATS